MGQGVVIALCLPKTAWPPTWNNEHVGDDLFNFDIGFDEYQQESLDMHWKVMRKTFKSLGEAYNFYNQYAYERGFSVRKDSLKYS